jgi:hypothetical protein
VPEQEEEIADQQGPNVATIAILGFMAGLILWVGGACLVLGDGGGDGGPSLPAGSVSTPATARQTPTALADRTNCAEIRGTDYRSPAERQWFLANCS